MSKEKAFEPNEQGLFWRIPLHFWGPLFLLSTIALASAKVPLDLIVLALVGYYLCANLKMRGFVYSLVLLGIDAPVRHLWISSDHLWSLGIEGSMACAFFIAAYAFEQSQSKIQSMEGLILTGKASLQNIEEEIGKERESALSHQIALQGKIDSSQKDLEELQSEHASILILNEVLRKTAAKQGEENEKFARLSIDSEHRIAVLQNELHESQKELARVKASDALAIENKTLMKELNAARYEKEQTHQINETLARMHARENLKVREFSEKIEEIAAAKKGSEERLKAELEASRIECKISSTHYEQAVQELEKTRRTFKELSEVNTQKNFLEERIRAAESELTLLRQKASQPAIDPEDHKAKVKAAEKTESLQQEQKLLSEQLSQAMEKIQTLSQTEGLYRQLKKQFEEKNEILHQTRSALFRSDTELERLMMEKAHAVLQFSPIPKEIGEHMEVLDQQIEHMDEENKHLQEIITYLSSKDPSSLPLPMPIPAPLSSPPKRKKKVKTDPTPDQDSLF